MKSNHWSCSLTPLTSCSELHEQKRLKSFSPFQVQQITNFQSSHEQEEWLFLAYANTQITNDWLQTLTSYTSSIFYCSIIMQDLSYVKTSLNMTTIGKIIFFLHLIFGFPVFILCVVFFSFFHLNGQFWKIWNGQWTASSRKCWSCISIELTNAYSA